MKSCEVFSGAHWESCTARRISRSASRWSWSNSIITHFRVYMRRMYEPTCSCPCGGANVNAHNRAMWQWWSCVPDHSVHVTTVTWVVTWTTAAYAATMCFSTSPSIHPMGRQTFHVGQASAHMLESHQVLIMFRVSGSDICLLFRPHLQVWSIKQCRYHKT